jgi:hypothetical protein
VDEGLKFPDGYTAGLRRSMNMVTGKLIGRLLTPVMFWGYFDDAVWMVLEELSYLYIQLCAKEITVEMMQKLEKEIPVLLCKMENFFPLGYFQSIATSPYTSSI